MNQERELLLRVFQKYLNIKMPQPLEQSGEIKHKDIRIKYILTKKASGKKVLDFLIFKGNGFPPVQKRIDANGEIQELERFEFSIMYETSEERREQEFKMKSTNRKIARSIISKGLAERDEKWIKKYL